MREVLNDIGHKVDELQTSIDDRLVVLEVTLIHALPDALVREPTEAKPINLERLLASWHTSLPTHTFEY